MKKIKRKYNSKKKTKIMGDNSVRLLRKKKKKRKKERKKRKLVSNLQSIDKSPQKCQVDHKNHSLKCKCLNRSHLHYQKVW